MGEVGGEDGGVVSVQALLRRPRRSARGALRAARVAPLLAQARARSRDRPEGRQAAMVHTHPRARRSTASKRPSCTTWRWRGWSLSCDGQSGSRGRGRARRVAPEASGRERGALALVCCLSNACCALRPDRCVRMLARARSLSRVSLLPCDWWWLWFLLPLRRLPSALAPASERPARRQRRQHRPLLLRSSRRTKGRLARPPPCR